MFSHRNCLSLILVYLKIVRILFIIKIMPNDRYTFSPSVFHEIESILDHNPCDTLPWIRVAVEKPTAGPGRAKEEGRRGRLWSPWTSLSGTAPIRINIQNLDVGFHWFISDRSREITHSLLCNLLSGRSPTNQSTQV